MKRSFYKLFFLLVGLICLLLSAPGIVWAQPDEPAEVGVFSPFEVSPGGRIEIPIGVRNVEELYAVDLTLRFNPSIVTVEDANEQQEGVQPALGTFLDAGLVLYNAVDNDAGIVRFAMTQVNPSEGKSGEGNLLVLYVRALVEGQSDLIVESVELSTRAGEAITVSGVNSSIIVSREAAESDSTPIPVQDPTEIIQVPTPEPTPTPIPTPIPTSTPIQNPTADIAESSPTPSELEGETAAEIESQPPEKEARSGEADQPVSQEENGFSLLRYWWAVLLLVLLVLGIAVYLFVIKK